MALSFYNTYTKQKEEFKPIKEGEIRIYSCGPTVYDFAHIGNLRAYVFVDLLRRYLKYKGYRLTHVINLTDVDDKIIKACKEKNVKTDELTKPFKKAYFDDIDALAIERVEVYPEATKHVKEMVEIVKKLLENGVAYEKDGSIYYRISEFPRYGKLSGMDLKQLKTGVRIDAEEYEKDVAADFALWKGWEESDGEIFWETELGKGRPGWHIECTAMSMKYLGNTFDIHTGGVDNIFPHHENEIAQSEAATGQRFVNYWIHNAHLMVEGKKMAKSFNNFYTLKDLLAKGLHPLAIRYVMLTTHYRQQLNFTFDGIEAALATIQRLWDFYGNIKSAGDGDSNGSISTIVSEAKVEFISSLDDDLNISPALASIFDMIKATNIVLADSGINTEEKNLILETLDGFDSVLGVVKPSEESTSIDEEVENLIKARNDARKNKDYSESDRIRDLLLNKGIILEDTKDGTKWKRKVE
ncbi:MAG: cysteine--tRNA ligase [candidate division Zixibacteria bacterium]|nr:cysteine--tRNA ligase [candidate division Zixibacteria bacterium]